MRPWSFHAALSRLAFLLAGSAGCAVAAPEICWTPAAPGSAQVTVEVKGLAAAQMQALRGMEQSALPKLLAVSVVQPGAGEGKALPMLGTHGFDASSGTLRFIPQFPLTAGCTYRAVFDGRQSAPGNDKGTDSDLLTAEFRLAENSAGPGAQVSAVYPSADVLPENLLKFYLHFSAPMSGGDIYPHIHLSDESGQEIELPFLEIGEELWDPQMKRLTLFIDPGRIKREVKPLEEIGPALVQGKRFTLTIDAAWKGADGKPMAGAFRKHFAAGEPDRTPIDPSVWKITAPAAGKSGAVSVAFPEPLDHALAMRLLRITDRDGQLLPGQPSVTAGECGWAFIPDQPWEAGDYVLTVPVTLEDLAGNNVGRAFEVDMIEKGAEKQRVEAVRLPFTVK